MAPGRCSRCGRPLPKDENSLDHPFSEAIPDAGTPGALPRSWASIDGADVCPDCQSPAERYEVAMRIVAAVEAEIERRRAEDIPPDDIESALVAYAMSLRQELDRLRAGAEPTSDRPAERPEIRETSRSTQYRVAVTGAFLTGHPLAVRIAGYTDLQSAIAGALRRPGWRFQPQHVQDGTFESGGGFIEALPLVIASRGGAELLAQLRYLLDAPNAITGASAVASPSTPVFDPTALSIDVYDLGVAVLTAWFDLTSASESELPAVVRTVKSMVWLRPSAEGTPPIADALQQIAHDTADDYGAAVRTATPTSIQTSWLSASSTGSSASAVSVNAIHERGRLLWLHPIHVFETADPSDRTTRLLAPAFHRTIHVSDGVFAPGIGWSAIVTEPGSASAATPVRLTQLHWAYYALYMEIDRGLLGILNQGRWKENAPLKELEDDADDVFNDYMRVMEARARLDSALTALGGDELALWEEIAQVQRFDAVVGAVERKLETLQRLTQRRVDQAAAQRARRISEILGGLTALTVLTVAIALIGYFVGTKSDTLGHAWLRILVVLGSFAVALSLYWLAYFRGRARNRDAP
jgi:hypothetical protein